MSGTNLHSSLLEDTIQVCCKTLFQFPSRRSSRHLQVRAKIRNSLKWHDIWHTGAQVCYCGGSFVPLGEGLVQYSCQERRLLAASCRRRQLSLWLKMTPKYSIEKGWCYGNIRSLSAGPSFTQILIWRICVWFFGGEERTAIVISFFERIFGGVLKKRQCNRNNHPAWAWSLLSVLKSRANFAAGGGGWKVRRGRFPFFSRRGTGPRTTPRAGNLLLLKKRMGTLSYEALKIVNLVDPIKSAAEMFSLLWTRPEQPKWASKTKEINDKSSQKENACRWGGCP